MNVKGEKVYIALGSNLGDRVGYIQQALAKMAEFVDIEQVSFLYETPPAYVLDQPLFLNAVCQGFTALSPFELLDALEQLMADIGRVRDRRYGPRVIDLDILLYGTIQVDDPKLTIPHALMAERDFVLQPLCDIAANLLHPVLGESIQQLNEALNAPPLPKVMPVAGDLWHWGTKSFVMGIINMTPDSFSGDGLLQDGGDGVQQAVAQAQRFAQEGADCLDVGGVSTKPDHQLISTEEEIGRIIPAIRAITQECNIPVSVDTFRAEVAEAAIHAGASMINDVHGLGYSQRIADVAAHVQVPLIVMHNRASVTYLSELELPPIGPPYEYEDVVHDVRTELAQRLDLAQKLSIPRWHLIGDPGIGFGKTAAQQLKLINQFAQLKSLGYPLLLGASRKAFIGKILGGLPADQCLEGNLATHVVGITRGADIVRVHDVQAMSRAVQLVDALVR
ncbi:MAG: dihydropteroate synthase [Chloroflexota bacterium]